MSERMNKESGTVDSREVLEYIRTICEDSIISDHTLEVCNRAIDLALKRIDDYGLLKTQLEIAEQTIKLNEWVDVRDRLPSDEEIAENYGEFEITYFDTVLKHQVTIAEFCKSNKYAIVEKDERGYWYDWEDDEIINVIAWRPLPKPYERKE